MLRAIRLISLAFVVTVPWWAAGDDLDYRDRGNRHEGIKRKPIGGYDVELLGAMVEPLARDSELFLETVSIRFFLDREEAVHLTVRERAPTIYYWLDRVQSSGWRSGATNLFSWPRREVLEHLRLRPADLLVLLRLGHDRPRPRERVAPALFQPAAGTGEIERYRFTFKTQARARSRHTVYSPGSNGPLEPSTSYSIRGAGVPFDVMWDARERPRGTYQLVLEGYFINDNVPFRQVVEFFHSPVWPG